MIGSFLAFAIRRNWSPSAKRAAFLGVLYSIVSFFAVVIAFQYGGLIASAAWLLLSAFILALIGTIKRDAHNG